MIGYIDTGFSIHDRLATEMNRFFEEIDISELINKRKTTLIQKDPQKGTTHQQLQTHNVTTDDLENTNGKIREEIFFSQMSRGMFRKEHKECCKRTRGTGTDQHILKNSKRRQKNLAMAWIDYQKVKDMVKQKLVGWLGEYSLSKTFLFRAIQFSISIDFVYTQLNVKSIF